MPRLFLRHALVFLGLFVLSGCTQPIERTYGYVPSDQELEVLVIGQTTKAEAANALGSPMTLGVVGDNQWLYSASRWQTRRYLAPEEVWRQVVVLSFDEGERLQNIERLGKADGRIIVLSREVTDSPIKDVGFFRQLFGNLKNIDLGRKATDFDAKRP